MVIAIVTTKLPLLFGAGPEPVAAPPKTGFWAFAYQARLDVTMLTACVDAHPPGSEAPRAPAPRGAGRSDYRTRPGATVAVLTTSGLPLPAKGE